jgi:uncharacterized protein YbjT (DUF2867 family)
MSGLVLVIGATGNVGLPLVRALLAKGELVKAASRSGKAVEGAAGVAVDVSDPASFGRALDGVDRVYLLAPTGTLDPKEALLPLIEAAAARKVKVVLQSVFGVEADDSIPYRQVEIALEQSGTPFVILRPNWFADNFHIFWKAGIDNGTIAVPAADGRSSFIDVRDIADAAAAALTTDRFDGKAYNLTGPAALGYADAAVILSSVLGRPVAYTPVDDAAFIDMLADAGVPRDYAAFLASIFHPVREGWTATVTDAVPTLTGHPARTVADYARDNTPRLVA